MMYWTYIIRSEKTGKYYVGSTQNVVERIGRHNRGKNKATKIGVPWVLIHKEKLPTRQLAYRREMQIKRYKGGEAFRKILN